MIGAIAVENSKNAKIGVVSATYVSQGSCPDSCSFKGKGCYTEAGRTGFTTRRLNQAQLSPVQLAKQEAEAIKGLSGYRPLRLHVVGDCKSNAAARIVSRAAEEYRVKRGSPVWTYTHAWMRVKRESWGSVSVLASCETLAQVREAQARGYAAALVVEAHRGVERLEDGIRLIPCLEQTGVKPSCEQCKLCWDDSKLIQTKSVIQFAAHGARREMVLVQIKSIKGRK